MKEQDFITNCLWQLNDVHADDRLHVLEMLGRFNRQRAHYRATMVSKKQEKLTREFNAALKRIGA
jgi:hypothetical protein